MFDKRGCVNFYVETPTRIGASDPPLSSCKKLEGSLKVTEPVYRRFFL
jgi:hypothetical protein